MFKNKKENLMEREQKAGTVNILGLGTEIKGDLHTKCDVRIDGKIIGNVISKAKVVLGANGEITGNVKAFEAEISGLITGDVEAAELLFLKVTAKIDGNITSNKLVIENGANFTGHCKTGVSHTKSIAKHQDAAEREQTAKEAIA